MKILKRIIIIFLLLLFAAIVALCVWQRENLWAVIKTVTTTDEQIKSEIDAGKAELETKIKEQNFNVISDFTAEEEKKIIKGEISIEEAVAELNKKYEKLKAEKVSNPKESGSVSDKVDELVGDKAIELYSLKAYYLGQLGQMEASVKKEYIAMPKEKQNLIGKKELVSKYMGVALSLMTQCDEKVENLLAELKGGLEDLKADTSIIKTIRDAYENEKALKKAYYLKLLGE